MDDDWALILHETFLTKKDVESELQVLLLNPDEESEVAKKRHLDDSSLTPGRSSSVYRGGSSLL